MSFQAPEFYKKMGFEIEFSRARYAKNTTFHYLKKTWMMRTSDLKILSEKKVPYYFCNR